jgi:hypothetical protein
MRFNGSPVTEFAMNVAQYLAAMTAAMDPQWIATAFSAVNSIRVVFYLPQIAAVARSVNGARDIALCTWAMWALTNALGAAYGMVVVHDWVLAGSFALSLLGCLVTIGLTVMQRAKQASLHPACRPTGRPCRYCPRSPPVLASSTNSSGGGRQVTKAISSPTATAGSNCSKPEIAGRDRQVQRDSLPGSGTDVSRPRRRADHAAARLRDRSARVAHRPLSI